MALSQIYTAISADIITAARWNNEFGNIYSNGTDVAFPLTKAVSFAGFTVTYDAAGISTITSPSNAGFLFTIGSKSGAPGANGNLATFTASTFTDTNTGAAGTASLWTGLSVRQPTIAASAVNVITTTAASFYVEGAPVAGANETLSGSYGIYTGGIIGSAVGADIASATTIAVVTNFATVTGTTTITGITQKYQSGTIFRLRFTGTGLNITHNGTSMISPWGRDYLTVPNEIIEFLSLGSGNYTFFSINGPKERVGVSVEGNVDPAPAGYLMEDGTSYLRASYPGLFAEVGTTFGSADGTHFNVPDTRGRTIIHVDGTANRITAASTGGANADTLGGAGGAETHTLTTAQLAAHTHVDNYFSNGSGNPANSQPFLAATFNATPLNGAPSEATGGGAAHNNTQPWLAKMKYIRF